MAIGVERRFDAGMLHLIAHVGGGLAVGNQLGLEGMSKAMKRVDSISAFRATGFQTSASNMSGSIRPSQLPGNKYALGGNFSLLH
jgi:hypothetical protein